MVGDHMGILGAVVFATPSVTTRGGRADPSTEAFDRSIDARGIVTDTL